MINFSLADAYKGLRLAIAIVRVWQSRGGGLSDNDAMLANARPASPTQREEAAGGAAPLRGKTTDNH
jgi:hypothetical protein